MPFARWPRARLDEASCPRDSGARKIEHLDAPLHNPPGDAEEVTVEEPGHPLYGRRFRVAFRSFRPGLKVRMSWCSTGMAFCFGSLPRPFRARGMDVPHARSYMRNPSRT